MVILRPILLAAAMAAWCACGQAPTEVANQAAVPDQGAATPEYSAVAIAPSNIRHFHGAPPRPLAPGMLASIYGERLGPTSACDGAPDPALRETPNSRRPTQTLAETQVFPTRLCDVQVLVGGVPAGLLYVHAGQINFKVPQETPVEGTATVQVIYRDQAGPAVAANLTADPQTAPAEQIAERMWSELQAVVWESTYPPAGANDCAAVEAQPGRAHGLSGYSHFCSQLMGDVIAESFYFPVAGEPPTLRLRRADFRLGVVYPAMSLEVEELLRQRLIEAHGPGSVPENLFEIGAYRSDPGRSWQAGNIAVFLHRNSHHVAGPGIREGVQLIAVRSEVMEERELRLQEDFTSSPSLSHTTIASDLRSELGDVYLPPPATRDFTDSEQERLAQNTRAYLMRVLPQVSEGSRERQAALLVAADDLTVRLGGLLIRRSVESGAERLAEAPEADEVRRELARYGVEYTGIGHYSGELEYDRSLLRRAWRELPSTRWGQRAFLMLQPLSCSGLGCSRQDCFRPVISQVEEFLRQHPDTPFRKEALYQLATAYETWWSLGQLEQWDMLYGEPIDRASAERARGQAIRLYEELFRLAPDSPETRAGQLVLPRLELSLGTGQRAFFCSMH